MSHTKRLWPGLTVNADNGSAPNAKGSSNVPNFMETILNPSSNPPPDSRIGIPTSSDSSWEKYSLSVSDATKLSQNAKTLSDAKKENHIIPCPEIDTCKMCERFCNDILTKYDPERLKIGDRVFVDPYGTGKIDDLPVDGIAWVKFDEDPDNSVRGIKIERLQKMEQKDKSNLEKNRMRGAGGAPTRATTLPDEPADRKNYPIASGVLDYFPDALVAIASISKAGNDQHNPGLPLRWTRGKSSDEADTCIRHFLQRGTIDTDGKRHTAKAAWRMLAILQKEIEAEQDKE